MQTLTGLLRLLATFAIPSLIGITPENAENVQQTNPDGTPKVDENGNPLTTSPEQSLIAALLEFANGTVTAVPFGTEIEAIAATGTGEAFFNALQYYDAQITKVILSQTLATEEGQHQTRAASGSHKDILDTLIRQAKRSVQRMLERDVLRVWMMLNGMSAQLPLCPRVSLGTTEEEDMAPRILAFSALAKTPLMHPSIIPWIDKELGIEGRDPVDATSLPSAETIQVKADAAGAIPVPGEEDDTNPPAAGDDAQDSGDDG